ncbi:MAG TPA: gas vesicle protein K [Allocoleopsis sp.]
MNTDTFSLDKPKNNQSGLAQLLLTVVELLRQLLEAQVIRRMDKGILSDEELDKAAESLQKLETQIVELCKIFDIDPAELNINLGEEIGSLLPKPGSYYPGENTNNPSLLELLDRILYTGIVVEGNVDIGLAQLDLIHAKLRLVLTSQSI